MYTYTCLDKLYTYIIIHMYIFISCSSLVRYTLGRRHHEGWMRAFDAQTYSSSLEHAQCRVSPRPRCTTLPIQVQTSYLYIINHLTLII